MRLHLAQIAVITNVVTNPILFDVPPLHWPARDVCDYSKSFEYGTRVLFTTAEVINLARSRVFPKLEHETRYIFGMNIVPNLLAFIAVYLIFAAVDIAFDQVAEKPVQLDTGVIGTCQTAASQTTRRHVVVSTVLLH